ncbi:leukotriene-A4 hydrolase [Panaeolus papilionaceus]|nr:leukotriene-A4 hydrolase [Panaeolus papilionaceus]
MASTLVDTATQSNYLEISTDHVTFDWKVDFERKTIGGSAEHLLKVKKQGVDKVVFDTGDLNISSVLVNAESVKFELKPKDPVLGSALHVPLPEGLESGSSVNVRVEYRTTEGATALQWLTKEQTQGKRFPYLFSQCQPIYARSMAPLQGMFRKYTAKVTSLLPVLLSARRVSPPSDGPAHGGKEVGKDYVTYNYDQPVPIPSYLLAIAVGNLVYKTFSKPEGKQWTSGIWAEPELIEPAFWEFKEDTTRFLAEEEEIVTPYKFGVYDLLVLPPSFPYGGMENACISFLTPTLLAGDRTLVDVVVHELTHSWFGNGVTHANPSHFWLNEGWTTYIERVLQQRLHSPAERGFQYVIGSKALYDSLKGYENKPKYQRLVIEFEEGEDPDDAYSSIPYEKGANFILYLANTRGLDVFLPYVRDYVDTFIGKSITTQQWKDHLFGYWSKHPKADEKIKALNSVDWNAWFFGEGTSLPVKMEYDLTLAEAAWDLAARWDAARTSDPSKLRFSASDLDGFNSNQIVVFLERLQSFKPLPDALLSAFKATYDHLATTPNAEIRLRYYQVALADRKSSFAKEEGPEAVKWVTGEDGTGVIKGRMKFCRPTLKIANDVDGLSDYVKEVWGRKRGEFHPIARRLVDKARMIYQDIGYKA